MTAAPEAAECGKLVILAARNAALGGRTALLYRSGGRLPQCRVGQVEIEQPGDG